jgi:transcriptional regulator with XRE-family HTH domain
MNVNIAKALKNNKVSQKIVAEKMGIARQSLYYFIKQADKNSFETIQRIADASGIDILEFFEETKVFKCPHCGKEINVEIK